MPRGDAPRAAIGRWLGLDVRRAMAGTAALTSLVGTLVGAATAPAAVMGRSLHADAVGTRDERVLSTESRIGIDALLSRETARMRESLASAALGSDHSMLLARKRSTDWAFLATAVTAGVGAGMRDPRALLASILSCDAAESARADGSGSERGGPPPWPRRPKGAHALVADALTCVADASGADFPCAIRWRVSHDGETVVARALWHEPMVAMRGFDAPLVPDRTTIRLDAMGTHVACWGFGELADPWPPSPMPLDQVGDSYEFADAARHWWWSRMSGTRCATTAVLCGAPDDHGVIIHLPECDVVRVSPWRVDSSTRVHVPRAPGADAPAMDSLRGSIAVPLRENPSVLHARWDRSHDPRAMLRVSWIEDGRCRGALTWHEATRARSAPRGADALPHHGWLDAQARMQLLQHQPTATVLPQPYSSALVLGDSIDESAAHARAAANVWQAAVTGDCVALTHALGEAEVLRRRRGLPRSMDAMALAALAESLLARGAPERSIALVLTRHLLVASALPPDRDAANAECTESDLMPSVARPDYARMLARQGRWWAASHCMGLDVAADRTGAPDLATGESIDPVVSRFSDWMSSRHFAAAGTGAPAAIHARTLATSSAESLSPSGGMASSSSIGSVSTASSELASGSRGVTIVRPFRCWPTSDAGSSSLMPALDFPRPWHSKQRDSKIGSSALYDAATSWSAIAAAMGREASSALDASGAAADARSAAHRARVT